MPTTFGLVLMGVLLVGAVAGLVLWARDASRRRGSRSTQAAEQTRTVAGNGWV